MSNVSKTTSLGYTLFGHPVGAYTKAAIEYLCGANTAGFTLAERVKILSEWCSINGGDFDETKLPLKIVGNASEGSYNWILKDAVNKIPEVALPYEVFGPDKMASQLVEVKDPLLFWAAPIMEHVVKGGYQYTCSFAVLLGEEYKESKLQKVWVTKEGPQNPVYVNNGNGYILESGSIDYYDGTQTAPDPLIAANLEDCTSCKGYVYVVFKDFDITKHGDVIPCMTFQVKTKGAPQLKSSGKAPEGEEVQLAAKVEQPPEGWFKKKPLPQTTGGLSQPPVVGEVLKKAHNAAVDEIMSGLKHPFQAFKPPKYKVVGNEPGLEENPDNEFTVTVKGALGGEAVSASYGWHGPICNFVVLAAANGYAWVDVHSQSGAAKKTVSLHIGGTPLKFMPMRIRTALTYARDVMPPETNWSDPKVCAAALEQVWSGVMAHPHDTHSHPLPVPKGPVPAMKIQVEKDIKKMQWVVALENVSTGSKAVMHVKGWDIPNHIMHKLPNETGAIHKTIITNNGDPNDFKEWLKVLKQTIISQVHIPNGHVKIIYE